jgi:hypothetical protein
MLAVKRGNIGLKERSMRTTVFSFLALMAISGTALLAQPRSPYLNGSDWQSSGNETFASGMKLGLLQGILEGTKVSETILFRIFPKEEALKILQTFRSAPEFDLTGTPYSQLVDGVDELYSDPTNRRIPIFLIATLANRKIKGMLNDQGVEETLQKLRGVNWSYQR